MPMTYEYKIIQAPNPEGLETRINELSPQGFRLLKVIPYERNIVGAAASSTTVLCAVMERARKP